jgi:hypothetical protein
LPITIRTSDTKIRYGGAKCNCNDQKIIFSEAEKFGSGTLFVAIKRLLL